MSLGEPVQGGLQAGVKELRHSNVFRGPGRDKNTAATAHGVLADGVVLDANYALQTRAADQPTLGRRGGGASAARARQ